MMGWRRVAGVGLILAAVAGAATSASGTAVAVAPLRHRAEFPLAGIVGLPGGRFLLWHSTGEMQVGTSTGDWTPVFRAAVRPVSDVIADAEGILVAGSLDDRTSGVVLLDTTGRELARWKVPDQVFQPVASERGRFATTRRGLVPLIEGGGLGPPLPYTEPPAPFAGPPSAGPSRAPPMVLRTDPGAMVLCRPRDLSMAHHAPGRCWKGGTGGWTRQGDFARAIACGDWLVTLEGSRPARLTAYSLVSGKPTTLVDTTATSPFACGAPGELIVGDARLRLIALPQPRPTWSSARQRAAVIDVAATQTALAYRLAGSLEVVIIPRPR
jgi:hypothetical protein